MLKSFREISANQRAEPEAGDIYADDERDGDGTDPIISREKALPDHLIDQRGQTGKQKHG